jgi:hypothetical protein
MPSKLMLGTMSIFGKKKEDAKLSTVEEIKLPVAGELGINVEPLETNVEPFKQIEQIIKETEKSKEVEEKPKEIQEKQKPPQKLLQEPPQEPPQEVPTSAPLFIKLDRYKRILNSMEELKTILAIIKNSFSMLSELEKLRDESLRLIENAIEEVDRKMSVLDSEFLRPSGYKEELSEEAYGVEDLETTLAGLRDQVSQLKSDLESLAR